MTLQVKMQERELISRREAKAEIKAEMLLKILRNCKNIQMTADLTDENPDYIRQIALDNGLTDLVDLRQ